MRRRGVGIYFIRLSRNNIVFSPRIIIISYAITRTAVYIIIIIIIPGFPPPRSSADSDRADVRRRILYYYRYTTAAMMCTLVPIRCILRRYMNLRHIYTTTSLLLN